MWWASLALAGPWQDCREESAKECGRRADALAEGPSADLALAAQLRELACRRGYLNACVHLARQLRDGLGVPIDLARALQLDRGACRLGSSYGCASAASALRVRAEAGDLRLALRLAEQSCAGGSGWGCNLAGVQLELGEVRFDPASAAERYQTSCDRHFSAGCHNLARLWTDGYGVAQDPWKARTLLRGACEARHGLSCLDEARWLLESEQRHPELAVGFLDKACSYGQDAGCVTLARLAPERAQELLEAACSRGFGPACLDLAELAPEQASERLWTACTSGVISACRASSERSRAAQSYEQAAAALQEACSLGDAYACDLGSSGEPLQIACRAGSAPACASWAQALGDSALGRQVRLTSYGTQTEPPSVEHAPALEPWRGCFEATLAAVGSPSMRGRQAPHPPQLAATLREVFGPLRGVPFQARQRMRLETNTLRVGPREIPSAPYVYSGSGAVRGRAVRFDPQVPQELAGQVAVLASDGDLYHQAWLAWSAGAVAVLVPTSRLPQWQGGEAALRPGSPTFPLAVPLLGVPTGMLPRDGQWVELEVELAEVDGPFENLLGVIPGRGELADEVLVLGAHYDHLGVDASGKMYPGADDNASGVAALACAAQTLQTELAQQPSARTVVVALFDGEEFGSLGSSALLNSGELEADQIAAMINLDMVGRLADRPLGLRGLGHAGLAAQVALASQDVGLPVGPDPDGKGASDDLNFRLAGVPALSLHTGTHREYHTPLDEVASVDLDGGARSARFASALALRLATSERLERVAGCAGEPDWPLGAQVGWYDAVVACVEPGSAAEALGLRPGDRIVGVGSYKIGHALELALALRLTWPHTETSFAIERQGSPMVLSLAPP